MASYMAHHRQVHEISMLAPQRYIERKERKESRRTKKQKVYATIIKASSSITQKRSTQ